MNDNEAQLKRRKATARCSIRLSVLEGRQTASQEMQAKQKVVIGALADALTATYQRQANLEEQAA